MPPSPAEIPTAFAQLGGLVKSAMTMQWRHATMKVGIKTGANSVSYTN